MQKIRLFISHSAHKVEEPDTYAFVTKLYNRLQGRADVFLDEERLETGEDWRDEIYLHLGLCDVAVIVLSPRAVRRESVWVPRECSILLWRKTLDPDFLIVPVHMPGLDSSRLDEGPFKDLGLPTREAIVESEADKRIDAVLADLKKYRYDRKRTPVDEVAGKIKAELATIKEPGISNALDTLGEEKRPWIVSQEARHTLALRLLDMELGHAVSFIKNELRDYAGQDPGVGARIFELLAPMWVDLRAAGSILKYSASPRKKTVMLLNASRRFVADMYVQRATCHPRETSWPIIEATRTFATAQEAVDEVEGLLIRRVLRVSGPPPYGAGSKRRMRERLKDRDESGEPPIVLMRPQFSLREKLESLKKEFPEVGFLVLTGSVPLREGAFHGVEARLLRPALDPAREEQVLSFCCRALDYLGAEAFAEECRT